MAFLFVSCMLVPVEMIQSDYKFRITHLDALELLIQSNTIIFFKVLKQ